MHNFVIPNPSWIAKLVSLGEVLIGIGLIVGLFTGAAAFAALLLNATYMFSGSAGVNPAYAILGVFLVLAWRNAGRIRISSHNECVSSSSQRNSYANRSWGCLRIDERARVGDTDESVCVEPDRHPIKERHGARSECAPKSEQLDSVRVLGSDLARFTSVDERQEHNGRLARAETVRRTRLHVKPETRSRVELFTVRDELQPALEYLHDG